MVTASGGMTVTMVFLARKARSHCCADSHQIANRAGLSVSPPLATTPVHPQPRLARRPGANPDHQSFTAFALHQKLRGARQPCRQRRKVGWDSEWWDVFQGVQ